MAQTTAQLRQALLNLDYEDLVKSCQVNSESQTICQDPAFWEEKAQITHQSSLRRVETAQPLSPEEKYIVLAQQGRNIASEEIMQSDPCLQRAIVQGRPRVTNVPLLGEEINVELEIISAVGNRAAFDDLLIQYQVDLGQEPELLYEVILEAIRLNQFPLLRDLLPIAQQLIPNDWQKQEIINVAASTGDYEITNFVYQNLYPGQPATAADSWLLQAALLRGDEEFSQELIYDLLERREYFNLANTLVRTGEQQRLVDLIQLAEIQGYEAVLGQDILLTASRYRNLSVVRLVAESPIFATVRDPTWFQSALEVAAAEGNTDIVTYLQGAIARSQVATYYSV